MTMTLKDVWASGDAYEPYVGRWSRCVAREFVDWLSVPVGRNWLDVGCGTGALTQTILDRAAPQSVVGVDPSEGFVAVARRVIGARAEFRIGDAQALPVDDNAFDAVVSGLVVNFVPDMKKAAAEMVRAARPGGTVAAYVWDYAGEMQMMRLFWDAAIALDPAALEKDEGRRFPVCRPEPLAALFREAGVSNVEVRAIDVPTQQAGAGAGLLHVAVRRSPRRVAGTYPHGALVPRRRQRAFDRAGLGGSRHRIAVRHSGAFRANFAHAMMSSSDFVMLRDARMTCALAANAIWARS